MMDACAQAIAIILLLAMSGCAPAVRHAPKPVPPYAACLPRPAPLPAIATVEQVRARHDALDRLYGDCASRLRQNLDAMK